jgi:hypothetical protein
MPFSRIVLLATLTLAVPALAQRHELGLTLGRFAGGERSAPGGNLDIGSGTALQADYGYRLVQTPVASLLFCVHLLAGPQRNVESVSQTATRDIASLYLTPGVRAKFSPEGHISPWVELGGGYAQYEHSTTRLDGQPNHAPRRIHRGAFVFGGGVDVKLVRFLSLRGEIRDYYSGSPSFNVLTSGSGQHNVVLGGGFLLRF